MSKINEIGYTKNDYRMALCAYDVSLLEQDTAWRRNMPLDNVVAEIERFYQSFGVRRQITLKKHLYTEHGVRKRLHTALLTCLADLENQPLTPDARRLVETTKTNLLRWRP